MASSSALLKVSWVCGSRMKNLISYDWELEVSELPTQPNYGRLLACGLQDLRILDIIISPEICSEFTKSNRSVCEM
jgi:hypothetical protein